MFVLLCHSPGYILTSCFLILQSVYKVHLLTRFQKHHLDLTASFTAVGSDCKYKWFVFVLGDGYD